MTRTVVTSATGIRKKYASAKRTTSDTNTMTVITQFGALLMPTASFYGHGAESVPTLEISCEGRTTLPWFTMASLPTMMLPHGSNRPSSAASRCSIAPYAPCGPLEPEWLDGPLPPTWYRQLCGATRLAQSHPERPNGTRHHTGTGPGRAQKQDHAPR